MSGYLLGPYADNHLDEIYEYTATNWGEDQADRYINTLFEYFDDVASKKVPWRSVPAEFGVAGHFGKCKHHFVYWKVLKSGDVGIVAVLHERMHQIERIQDLFRIS
jgi:toxin ParE1/3/4